jgi:hypothetical protein
MTGIHDGSPGAAGAHGATGSAGSNNPGGVAHPRAPAAPPPSASADFDHDLDVPAILWTAAGVIVITLLSVAAVWAGFKALNRFDRNQAEAPSPMAAIPQPPPPGPRLQAAPTADMQAMHAEDDLLLEHAGWVDRAQGTVRVPIDVAIDVIAERGLPRVTTPPLAAMAAHGSYANDGRPPTDQPSPGTLLVPPGMGIGSIGPPAAGAGQQFGAAQPGPLVSPATPPPPAPLPPQPSVPRTPTLPPPPPGGRP